MGAAAAAAATLLKSFVIPTLLLLFNYPACMADNLLHSGQLSLKIWGNVLHSGQSLKGLDFLYNNGYILSMGYDCNLVLKDKNKEEVWSTGTSGKGEDCYCTLETNGNLVIYTPSGTAVWSSNSFRWFQFDCVLILEDDGNLVIYGGSIWSSNTQKLRSRRAMRVATVVGPSGTNHTTPIAD